MLNIVWFVVLSFIVGCSEGRGKQWLCPPSTKVCNCNSKKGVPFAADCHNRHLKSIPRFVQHYRKLKFSGNNLQSLSFQTFKHLRELNGSISELYINACRIHEVNRQAFNGLKLDFIDFSYNRDINQTQLAQSFRNVRLKGIALSGIPLGAFASYFFNTTQSESLEFVRIASCNLKVLSKDMFKYMVKLVEVDISNNPLIRIDFSVFRSLEVLTARNARLTEPPDFENQTSNVRLIRLDFSFNMIRSFDIFYEQSQHLENLEHLFLDSNPVQFISPKTFSNLTSLCSLSLCNMTSLKSFKGVYSKSLRYLNISNNILDPRFSKTMFQSSSRLLYLNMHSTSLSDWSETEIHDLFLPLCRHLERLHLAKTYFKIIPSRILRCLKLKVLDLSSNNITGWNESTFANVTVKSRIYLRNNLIQLINSTSFPGSIMDNCLPFLDISGNPLACTCDAHWFRNWCRGRYKKLRSSLGRNYVCQSPNDWMGKHFYDFDVDYEDCFGMYGPVIVAFSLCVFCLVGVTVASTCHNRYKPKERKYIRMND